MFDAKKMAIKKTYSKSVPKDKKDEQWKKGTKINFFFYRPVIVASAASVLLKCFETLKEQKWTIVLTHKHIQVEYRIDFKNLVQKKNEQIDAQSVDINETKKHRMNKKKI